MQVGIAKGVLLQHSMSQPPAAPLSCFPWIANQDGPCPGRCLWGIAGVLGLVGGSSSQLGDCSGLSLGLGDPGEGRGIS